MKPIPSLFEPVPVSKYTKLKVNPACQWVFDDPAAVPTIMWDGDTVRVDEDRRLWYRVSLSKEYLNSSSVDSALAKGVELELVGRDEIDGAVRPGFFIFWQLRPNPPLTYKKIVEKYEPEPGIYSLVGPSYRMNPHRLSAPYLAPHDMQFVCSYKGGGPALFEVLGPVPLSEVPTWLWMASDAELEKIDIVQKVHAKGIVWRHPDGRCAKATRKQLGFQWPIYYTGKHKTFDASKSFLDLEDWLAYCSPKKTVGLPS